MSSAEVWASRSSVASFAVSNCELQSASIPLTGCIFALEWLVITATIANHFPFASSREQAFRTFGVVMVTPVAAIASSRAMTAVSKLSAALPFKPFAHTVRSAICRRQTYAKLTDMQRDGTLRHVEGSAPRPVAFTEPHSLSNDQRRYLLTVWHEIWRTGRYAHENPAGQMLQQRIIPEPVDLNRVVKYNLLTEVYRTSSNDLTISSPRQHV